MHPFIAAAATFLIAAVLIIMLRRHADALGLVDFPSGRKSHGVPVPAVGGLAMYAAFVPALLYCLPGWEGLIVATGLGSLVLVGVLDDRFELRARVRILVEILVVLVLAACSHQVAYLGNLVGFGAIYTGAFGIVFSLVCYVGLINALNMVDGIDGLAASLSLVAMLFFTGVSFAAADFLSAQVGAAAIGALLAFLAFNLRSRWRSRASVFMGDAGSMFLGCLLAWMAIGVAGRAPVALSPIGAVWILAVPLLDMGSVMMFRIRHGRSPFEGDRRHFHYLLVDSGMSVPLAVSLLSATAVVCGVIGIGFQRVGIPEWVMLAAFLMAWIVAYRIVAGGTCSPAMAVAPGANRENPTPAASAGPR